MNLTLALLAFVSEQLREHAFTFEDDTHEQDTLLDAADALDDAKDLLIEGIEPL